MKNLDHISTIPLLGLYINADGQLIEPQQGLEISGLRAEALSQATFGQEDQWDHEVFTRLDGPSQFNQ